MVEDAVAQTANRMVGAVRAYAIREQHVCLFGLFKHPCLFKHEGLWGLFGKHQQGNRAVKLTYPHVHNLNSGVLQTCIQVVVLHLALGALPVSIGVAAVATGSAGVLDDDPFHLFNVPANLLGGFRILDEGIEFVKQILATGTGYFDVLLGCRGLARDEEVAQSAYTKLPTVWVFEVSNADSVFGELGAKAKVAAVELRPLTQHLGKLFGNDVVRVLARCRLTQPRLDVHQLIQRCVEVNIRRHRHIQIPLGLTEV